MGLLCFKWYFISIIASAYSIPVALIYEYNVREAVQLPKEDDVSSPEIKLNVPIVFFGVTFDAIFVNSNGLLSFQTEIPDFFNIEFPLSYPVISPFYSNIDLRKAGTVSYYQTTNPSFLQRATSNVHESFSNHQDFQATNLFIVTWFGVGYHNQGSDKINTFQVIISTDGRLSFVEFLYPENGIQWIQGTGDESGLPDARAQAGFISPDGKVFSLPGSGSEQVRNLERWSNVNLNGQFIFRVDGPGIVEPDQNNEGSKALKGAPVSCAQAPTYCHVHATCRDYEQGFCCKCKDQHYGNGKFCVKKDVPLRVNGKINGNINDVPLENLDLQSYVVMVDGRAYTAISKIPERLSFDVQSLQILGGVIGYVFAKPVREALNGYQLSGGVFNHTATIEFLNTTQKITIKQRYLGLDVFDQLRLEATIQGEIPKLPRDSKVVIDEYEEQYTLTSPGVIQMTATRSFKYNDLDNVEHLQYYSINQVFLFDYCKYETIPAGETFKLKVVRNFISYESREQIIRFGLSNKITPLGDFDPCETGRSQCVPNSACVVENDSFRCICNSGYQYSPNGTTCVDIDECQMRIHDCNVNAQCINRVGSYSCQCNAGFEGDGHSCQNPSSICQTTKCDNNAECIEHNRMAICRCLPGFTGDGLTCNPVTNDRATCREANNCSPNGLCQYNRASDSYYCSCQTGYEGDGYNCQKISENNLSENCNSCGENAVCDYDRQNDRYYCSCSEGYEGDGYSCEKIDENVTEVTQATKEIQRCLLGVCWCPSGYKIEQGTSYCIVSDETTVGYTTEGLDAGGFNDSCYVLNNCDDNAQCIYSQETQTYNCVCNQGFDGSGYICQPEMVSCTQVNNCDPHATCTYDESLGKSKCICNLGYEGDGEHCRINAICTSHDDCTETEECRYTNSQRYECVCKEGYSRDSQNQCVKLGTCGGGTCVENAECLYDDEYQTHYCTCKTGYFGDGITECKLKPIGCNVLNNCGLHATCHYDESTTLYQCKCDKGFYGDGFICYTEINCHIDPTMCDPQATCITDANRRYICQCNTGFVGNGSLCKPIPKHDGNFLLLNQGMATLKIPFEPTKNNLGKPIQLKYYQTAVGLDIDCFEGRVYWSDVSGMAIRSSTYNGSDKQDFITNGIGSPEGLTIDWISRNIYWTDSTKDTIEVANIDRKLRRVLFDTNLINPRGIIVHPQRGKIFWTDWDRKNPKIEWSNADGTGREIFLRGESVSLPNSLTIDYDTEQLCYADAGTKKIECVDIDTRQRHTIAVNCTYPFGITVTDQHIYWSDWISKKIERVEKFSLIRLPPLQVPLGGSGNKLFGLVAVPSSCPPLTNVCEFYKDQCPAEHICLPDGAGSRRCVCSSPADNLLEKPSCSL